MTLNDQQVKEIAGQLDCGFRVFVHKHTGALVSIPYLDNNPYAEESFYKEELRHLKKHYREYLEITGPQSHDRFEVMTSFTEQLDNEEVKGQLFEALNKRKPFQEFKRVIDSSGPYRQLWFAYKEANLKKWVLQRLAE